jgi:hypothetical protein
MIVYYSSNILYIPYFRKKAMKKTQLLSVVLFLIMFTGITAGTAVAYAESENNDYDFDDKLERFCEMTEDDKAAFIEEHNKAEEHQEKMTEYCMLDESEREAFIEKHKAEYMKHGYNIREKINEFCEMTDEDQAALIEEYQKSEEHMAKLEEYCSLDEEGRDALIEEYKDSMKDKMSDYKGSMKDKMSERSDSMNSMHKSYTILRASTLTDEQKDDIKVKHAELRDFKHSLRDQSLSDSDKQEIRDQFMEKAKEFSMTWLSPRHQVAAGIEAQMVECNEAFTLVMKTSNATPMCVKETTAEKLIERGIAITAI